MTCPYSLSDDLGVEQINRAVLARYQNNGTRITHFSSALLDGDGFVPNQSGDQISEDPNFAGSIADLLDSIAHSGDDRTVANKLNTLVRALKRQPSQEVEKSRPNVNGPTREPLRVATNAASIRGRTPVVDGQAFSAGTQVFNTTSPEGKALLKGSKKDVALAVKERALATHEDPTVELKVNRGTMVNFSR